MKLGTLPATFWGGLLAAIAAYLATQYEYPWALAASVILVGVAKAIEILYVEYRKKKEPGVLQSGGDPAWRRWLLG